MSETTLARSEVVRQAEHPEPLAVYFVLGIVLGIIFIKSEVASWFRIQEMFRFQAVHMYGVIGGAVGVGALGVALLQRLGVRTIRGEPIEFPDAAERRPGIRHAAGGTIFGLGWGSSAPAPARSTRSPAVGSPSCWWRSSRPWRGPGCTGSCGRACPTEAQQRAPGSRGHPGLSRRKRSQHPHPTPTASSRCSPLLT